MKCLLSLSIVFLALTQVSAQQSDNNDEFDNPATLTQWMNITDSMGYNAEHFDSMAIVGGQLVLEPFTSAWFDNYRGGYIYKELTGDFVFTTQVDASTTESSLFSLAGLFLRIPQTAMEITNNNHNYVFLSTGYANPDHFTCPGLCPGPHLEVKNTVNSTSDLRVAEVSTGPVTIRIARLGHDIICLYRPDGATDFIVHQRYERNDFPNTIQAGFVAYTDWPKVETYTPEFHNHNVLDSNLMPDPSNDPGIPFTPDITASFDFARFDDVVVPNGLDPATATDEELLEFLGYNSTAVLPIVWGNVSAVAQSQDVLLAWEAQSLTEHDKFVVEYSHNGENFVELAEIVDPQSAEGRYLHVHEDVGEGPHYYRVRQVDLDGSSSLSPVVMAEVESSTFVLVPNPATDRVQIRTSIDYQHLQLINAQGQLIMQSNQASGEVDVSDLPSGMYQVILTKASGTKVGRALIK